MHFYYSLFSSLSSLKYKTLASTQRREPDDSRGTTLLPLRALTGTSLGRYPAWITVGFRLSYCSRISVLCSRFSNFRSRLREDFRPFPLTRLASVPGSLPALRGLLVPIIAFTFLLIEKDFSPRRIPRSTKKKPLWLNPFDCGKLCHRNSMRTRLAPVTLSFDLTRARGEEKREKRERRREKDEKEIRF